jgi:3-oxoacyl-(acyl-carrier-protein) synthase
MDRAVAITGMGAVTAQGVGVAATWEGVVAGHDALRPWSGLRDSEHPLSKVKVAECPALPRPADLPGRLWKRLSRTQQLACVAVDEALGQAGLPHALSEFERCGLFLATTVCGMDTNERYYAQYREDRENADVDLMRRLQPYEVGTLLQRRHRVRAEGINHVCLTTCVGSAMAIGAACDAIALGECEMAIAGGSEALCRVVLSGFHSLRVVSPEGCRPFDKDRPGITVGEGAGIVVLESVEHARRRGVEPLAFVRGFGVTCDAHHITAPDPEAREGTRAIRDALNRSGLRADQIDYINAHGTGTRDNDSMEARAIRNVFSERSPVVSSTKRSTGHTFGAAGVVEAILCVQAMREGIAPMNAGSVQLDPTIDLPVVRGESRRTGIRATLSTNFAFGGNNTALVIARDTGDVA